MLGDIAQFFQLPARMLHQLAAAIDALPQFLLGRFDLAKLLVTLFRH
jgi:hypothetical protein